MARGARRAGVSRKPRRPPSPLGAPNASEDQGPTSNHQASAEVISTIEQASDSEDVNHTSPEHDPSSESVPAPKSECELDSIAPEDFVFVHIAADGLGITFQKLKDELLRVPRIKHKSSRNTKREEDESYDNTDNNNVSADRNEPGSQLAPLSDLEEIFGDLTDKALHKGLKHATDRLGSRPLNVATLCSGTEAPILALQLIGTGKDLSIFGVKTDDTDSTQH